jgi:hypothetical protein
MVSSMRKHIHTFLFLILLALPLVFISGTTWDSDSDDLIPTLISIENWRFLFWGHSRFGTLVPLIAKPFTDIPTNLLFQNFIHAFSIIIFIYALSKVFYRKFESSSARSLTFSTLVYLFLLTNPTYLAHLISGLPYAAPLGIFGICLLLSISNINRIVVLPTIVVLIAASCWVNPLNGYYLAPLIFVLLALKKYKSIFFELVITYLLITFGLFFVVLGIANGENGGFVEPNFRAFKILNWWIPLFTIQLILIARALIRREFRKCWPTYLSFLLTWLAIFALTSLKHIYMNAEAPRYFITATFVSMCVTMANIEELIFSRKNIRLKSLQTIIWSNQQIFLPTLIFSGIIVNIFLVSNLRSDYPLREPQKTLLTEIFKENGAQYRFASGDFWYTWPTKVFASNPEEIFVTSFESENQYDIATDAKTLIQSRLKNGDRGLCFGEIKACEFQLQFAVDHLYGPFNSRVEIIDVVEIYRSPIKVHSLKILITSK